MTAGRFEVLERSTYGGVDLWRILDRRYDRVDYVLFAGNRYATGQVTTEAEARYGDLARRPSVLTKLAHAVGVDLNPPPPPPPRRMCPLPPVALEPDAGYLWRMFIYGTNNPRR